MYPTKKKVRKFGCNEWHGWVPRWPSARTQRIVCGRRRRRRPRTRATCGQSPRQPAHLRGRAALRPPTAADGKRIATAGRREGGGRGRAAGESTATHCQPVRASPARSRCVGRRHRREELLALSGNGRAGCYGLASAPTARARRSTPGIVSRRTAACPAARSRGVGPAAEKEPLDHQGTRRLRKRPRSPLPGSPDGHATGHSHRQHPAKASTDPPARSRCVRRRRKGQGKELLDDQGARGDVNAALASGPFMTAKSGGRPAPATESSTAT